MPCRPPEYDLGRSDGERAEAEAEALIEQRHRLRRVLLAFNADPHLSLPRHLRKALGHVVSEKPDPLPPRPEDAQPERYPEPVQGVWALELAYRVAQEEKVLCEARTVLVQVVARGGPPASVRKECERQIQAHRRHRREDLEAVRGVLRLRIERLGHSDLASRSEVQALQRKLERAEALTVDDILDDRGELDRLWPGR